MNDYEISGFRPDPLSEDDRKELDVAINSYIETLHQLAKMTDGYSDEYQSIMSHYDKALNVWYQNHHILEQYKKYREEKERKENEK